MKLGGEDVLLHSLHLVRKGAGRATTGYGGGKEELSKHILYDTVNVSRHGTKEGAAISRL